ncbi:MAG: sigma-70 family RNA polymerase sigma factor [Planctomycetes bacterium]|nr:sigma-70 family RNA polymerase sigma factor [Planctomycetota bacterium]
MTSLPRADHGEDAGDDPAHARAFAALVERAGARLVGLALALVGERAAAEDVVQEALARVWRRRHALAPGALDGYVRQAVRNLALDRRARAEAEARALSRRAGAAADVPGDDEAERVTRALSRLADEQREVVVLRVYEGLEFKEIAARTGAPLGTVHSRYRLALERLRPHLERGDA